MLTWTADDEQHTARLGRVLADTLPPGTVVALVGTLGSGKTALVRAVVEALGLPGSAVTSPTFVLVHEYPARTPVVHMDAYRLRDLEEFYELGAEEYFSSPALVLVEWADRVQQALPPDRLEVQIDVLAPEKRLFRITGHGACRQLEPALAEKLNSARCRSETDVR